MQKHHDHDFWTADNAAEGNFQTAIFVQPHQQPQVTESGINPLIVVLFIVIFGLVGGWIHYLINPAATRDGDLPLSPPEL